MSIQMNYESTFLEMLSKSYEVGSYIRTFGFAAPGDGGAAMYRVASSAPTAAAITTVNNVGFCYGEGCFYQSGGTVFEVIPQNGRIFAEQFGVLPDDESYSVSNQTMLHYSVIYAASRGYRLEFASKGTYYFTGGVTPVNNLHIDGNGATLKLHGSDTGYTFFYLPGVAKNVTFRNITCIGRRTADTGYGDQFLYSSVENLTMQNVTLKNFAYGLRTYTFGVANDYDQPEIVNKNWLIEDCSITDTVMGMQLSEIDGITVRNTVNTSIYPNGDEATLYPAGRGTHNVYMSSNCLNVRFNNVTMGNVTGDAVHKAYAVNSDEEDEKVHIRFDKSKNHFYTDLSIHKCNAPMSIGFISENVMCDNVLATKLRYCIYLSAASNCIIANSSLIADRDSIKRYDDNGNQYDDNPNLGLYIRSACSCWFQNSYLYTNGRQRVCTYKTEDHHYKIMSIKALSSTDEDFVDKKHKRIFIGENFDIPNYWFKFTGCDFIYTQGIYNTYFYEKISSGISFENKKSQYCEYWDNCYYLTNTNQVVFRLYCSNDFPGGLTFRNSYFENNKGTSKAPFRYCCLNGICSCCCPYLDIGKCFPWLHFENNVFNTSISGSSNSDWSFLVTTDLSSGTNLQTSQAIKISNSYMATCYIFNSNGFSELMT